MRRLIINADDFGITAGVNRGIVESHRRGMVTSATLMAAGSRFDEAVQLAKQCPELSVGCHVVLVDGTAIRSVAEIPSLIRDHDGDIGRFRESLSSFAASAMFGSLAANEIESEVIAQIRRLQAAGLAVTHLDTHKHAHIFPGVLKPLLRAAHACGIRLIRNPFVPRRALPFRVIGESPQLAKRYFQVQLLRAVFSRQFRRAVKEAGMISPLGSVGVAETGFLDDALFHSTIKAVPEGTWELVCHPGCDDQELAGIKTRLRQSRARELEVLSAPTARKLLADEGIELISYRELAAEATR